jgi:hypothetical protein
VLFPAIVCLRVSYYADGVSQGLTNRDIRTASRARTILMRNIILILLVLMVSYAGARLLSGNSEVAGRISITAVFCFTALGRFAKPIEMLEMLPSWVPARKGVVLLSGLLELAFAIGILLPTI